MSYMKDELENAVVRVIAVTNDHREWFYADISGSNFREAEINFTSLMEDELNMRQEDYIIENMELWSESK